MKGRELKLTFGLYSAFLACNAIVFRSSRQSRLTVATMFLLDGERERGRMDGWTERERGGVEGKEEERTKQRTSATLV